MPPSGVKGSSAVVRLASATAILRKNRVRASSSWRSATSGVRVLLSWVDPPMADERGPCAPRSMTVASEPLGPLT